MTDRLEVVRRNGDRHLILFDAADWELLRTYTWRVVKTPRHDTCYAQASTGVLMHVLLMGQAGVDHVNRNGLDNRRANLRLANQSQNGANRKIEIPGQSSCYKGVRWHAQSGKWRATVTVDGRQHSLGLHVDAWEAAQAYNEAALEAWGSFARLNVQRSVETDHICCCDPNTALCGTSVVGQGIAFGSPKNSLALCPRCANLAADGAKCNAPMCPGDDTGD